MTINVLSLFDGMSCGRIALERAEIEVNNYYASEIDKYAIEISKKNYPGIIQLGDILDWKNWDLPNVDLILAGSPCQGFSNAGNGLNFEDPRSKLFFEFVDILKHYSPAWFLLENVRMKKEYQDVISEYVNVEPIKINSSLVSAQNRVRLYWTNVSNIRQPDDRKILLKSVLDNPVFVPEGLSIREKSKTVRVGGGASPPLSKQEWDNVFIKTIPHGFVKEKVIIRDKYPTLTAQHPSSKYVIWNGCGWRKLSVSECERLQTIPDSYTKGVSNAQRYKMIGNGWTVDIITHILKNIKS